MTTRDEMNANYSKVKKRIGGTTGASKGNHGKTKGKISLKGTKPHKGEYAATWKKKI